MPERSRHQGDARHLDDAPRARPRHAAIGDEGPSWWQALNPRHIGAALVLTFAAMPVLVLDNLPQGPASAEAVETVHEETSTTVTTTSTTVAPTTTTPPTTAPPTTAPPTTAPPTTTSPTTAPPTTAVRRVSPPPTTVPPTTAPPTTAPPPPPPPSAGSVEATIRANFPAEAGDAAVAVARCESSLNPSARSASGYRGLFQLSPSHAEAFAQVTGRDFEDAWDEAGPNSQYAAYLYAQRGWAPWGSCAP